MALYVDIEKKLGSFHLRAKFEVDGETLALLGASGCGKSMTLKCIAGIEKPDRGQIILDGETLFDSGKHIDLPPQKRRVGYLFQQYALFPSMTAEQNILCCIRSGTRAEKRRALAEAVRMFRLEGLEKKLPAQLSGGQQQRVALARILVSDPQILLLDEPFSALDQHLRFRLERELHQTLREFGKTAIFVSHDRDEVYRLADRIVVMEHGRVETSGTKKDVFRDPHTRAAAALTGCKNISRAAMLPDGSFEATDWGITLRKPGFSGGCVGIRMHDVRPGRGENEVRCDVVEVIENPFSFTVLLRPAGRTDTTPVGWEMEKDVWRAQQAEQLWVHFPAEGLLALEETEGQA